MKKLLIAASLIGLSHMAVAADVGFDIYGRSHHPDARPGGGTYNEANYGLGGRVIFKPIERVEISVQAGGWYNSFRDAAWYSGIRETVNILPHVYAGWDTRWWASRSYASSPYTMYTLEIGIANDDRTRIAILNKGVTMLYLKHDF